MRPDRPLLTIAIPTCNRARHLANLLESLAPQLADEPRVQLLVSDNGSTDDTPAVVAAAIESGLRLVSLRNPVNLGFDGNFLQCYNRAEGAYFWLFGDDDFITPGGVRRILDLLSGGDCDIVFCAPYVYYSDYMADLGRTAPGHPTEITDDVVRFVQLVNYRGDFIFISTAIVNKDRLMASQHPAFESMLGTSVVQLGWIFTSLAHFKRGVFVEAGTVAGAAAGSGGGFNPATVFGVNYANAVAAFVGSDSRLAKTLLNDHLFAWFTNNWVSIRQRPGLLGEQSWIPVLRTRFQRNPRFWLVVLPLVALPLSLARLWALPLRVLKRLNRILRGL